MLNRNFFCCVRFNFDMPLLVKGFQQQRQTLGHNIIARRNKIIQIEFITK